MPQIKHDLTRTVLAVACIAGLVGISFWVLRPFLGAAIWAAMLVVTTWPLLGRLERAFGNRRGLAVTVMTLALLLLLVVPMWAAIDTLADNSGRIAGWAKALAEQGLPPPPDHSWRVVSMPKPLLARIWSMRGRDTCLAAPKRSDWPAMRPARWPNSKHWPMSPPTIALCNSPTPTR